MVRSRLILAALGGAEATVVTPQNLEELDLVLHLPKLPKRIKLHKILQNVTPEVHEKLRQLLERAAAEGHSIRPLLGSPGVPSDLIDEFAEFAPDLALLNPSASPETVKRLCKLPKRNVRLVRAKFLVAVERGFEIRPKRLNTIAQAVRELFQEHSLSLERFSGDPLGLYAFETDILERRVKISGFCRVVLKGLESWDQRLVSFIQFSPETIKLVRDGSEQDYSAANYRAIWLALQRLYLAGLIDHVKRRVFVASRTNKDFVDLCPKRLKSLMEL